MTIMGHGNRISLLAQFSVYKGPRTCESVVFNYYFAPLVQCQAHRDLRVISSMGTPSVFVAGYTVREAS